MSLRKIAKYETLALFAIVSIIVYIIVRGTLLFFAEYNSIEKVMAIILICGELFVIIHGLGYTLNILRILKNPSNPETQTSLLKEEPTVAVLVAARNEPREVLEETFITLNNLNYRNKIIYFLDDSSDEKFRQEADRLSREYNLTIFRRSQRRGAKAGIINDCLKTLTQEYVAVFDADQNPIPEFLNAVMPLLENNKNLGFVQTPQFYTNIEKGRVARAAALQQAVFYEYICEGKSEGGSMFCCGTNVIFRRKALLDVGGLDESTVTEDFATSVKLHAKGWKSLYFNHVYAFGMGPEDLASYFKQQFRWAVGTISVFKQVIWKFLTKPNSLKPLQWWEYFLSSSYYLVGIAYLIMIICPVIYLLFRIPSFFASPEIYFLAFLPYIIFSTGVFYVVLRGRQYKMKDLFLGQLLGEITIPVYIQAAISAILGSKITFGVTGKNNAKAISCLRLWPQFTLVFLCFIAVIWGLNRFIYEREAAILVNSFWTMYHCIILSSVFYFNQEAG
ncbi:MAG: glycosyltransferase [Candidatus Omnitrophota bacterium]|nr:glycosyltransferase [Candidatus Omnitrophota bacterium]